MKERSSSINNWFFELLIILYLLHSVPVIGLMTPAFLYAGIMVLLYLCTIYCIGIRPFFQYFVKTIPITVFVLLGFVRGMLMEQGVGLADVYRYLQIVIYLIIGQHIINTNSVHLAKHLYVVLIIMYATTAITSFVGFQNNPLASRELATTIAEDDEVIYNLYRQLNIGGFSFIYTLVLFIPLLIGQFKNKIGNRVVVLLVVSLFVMAIISSQYATALLLSLLSVVIIFVRKDFDKQKSLRVIILVLLLLFVLRSIIPTLMLYISQNIDSQIVSERLEDLSLIFSGEQQVGHFGTKSDLDARSMIYQKSIDSFYNSFPIGTWDLGSTGGHSFMLDNLALYGIFGIIGFFGVWICIYRVYFKSISYSSYYGFFLISLIFSIMLSILNPIVFYSFLGFTIPVFIVLFRSFENK